MNSTQMFIGDLETEIDFFLQAFANCVKTDQIKTPLSDFSLELTLDRTDISAVTFANVEATERHPAVSTTTTGIDCPCRVFQRPDRTAFFGSQHTAIADKCGNIA